MESGSIALEFGVQDRTAAHSRTGSDRGSRARTLRPRSGAAPPPALRRPCYTLRVMIPSRELARAVVPGEPLPLILYQRDTAFEIRLGPHLLMTSLAHGSEEVLAERVCRRISGRSSARLLIGGLGMGFTLAAALRELRSSARVVVAELVPAVVEWNRGPLRALAGQPLEDPRVTIVEDDVAALLRPSHDAWDAILLDVDNGPDGLTRATNDRLYGAAGLAAAFAALRPGGLLGVWSVQPDRGFARRLSRAGFLVEEEVVRARRTKGGSHTLWFAARPLPGAPRRPARPGARRR